MNNKNTYYIPVEITNVQYLKVEAVSESEAINLVEASIHNNNLRQKNDIVKIIRENIECEQDDNIYEKMLKDFELNEDNFRLTFSTLAGGK